MDLKVNTEHQLKAVIHSLCAGQLILTYPSSGPSSPTRDVRTSQNLNIGTNTYIESFVMIFQKRQVLNILTAPMTAQRARCGGHLT